MRPPTTIPSCRCSTAAPSCTTDRLAEAHRPRRGRRGSRAMAGAAAPLAEALARLGEPPRRHRPVSRPPWPPGWRPATQRPAPPPGAAATRLVRSTSRRWRWTRRWRQGCRPRGGIGARRRPVPLLARVRAAAWDHSGTVGGPLVPAIGAPRDRRRARAKADASGGRPPPLAGPGEPLPGSPPSEARTGRPNPISDPARGDFLHGRHARPEPLASLARYPLLDNLRGRRSRRSASAWRCAKGRWPFTPASRYRYC